MISYSQIKNIKGFLIDLDGTVFETGKLIPGAKEVVEYLQQSGIPFRFVTNTTRKSRRMLMENLEKYELPVNSDLFFTAPLAAKLYLEERSINKISFYIADAAKEDFTEFTEDESAPEALLIGDLGNAWNYDLLNKCFRQIMDGAEIIAIQKNKYWKTEDGLSLDAGPFIAALEYATDNEALLMGKPNKQFFKAAVKSMGLNIQECAMIGDDLDSDVIGMNNAGGMGIQVRTGKFRDSIRSIEKPHLIIDSIHSIIGIINS